MTTIRMTFCNWILRYCMGTKNLKSVFCTLCKLSCEFRNMRLWVCLGIWGCGSLILTNRQEGDEELSGWSGKRCSVLVTLQQCPWFETHPKDNLFWWEIGTGMHARDSKLFQLVSQAVLRKGPLTLLLTNDCHCWKLHCFNTFVFYKEE